MLDQELPTFTARFPGEETYTQKPPTPELFQPGVVFRIEPSLNDFVRKLARSYPIPWIPQSDTTRRTLFLDAEQQNSDLMLGARNRRTFTGAVLTKVAVILPPEQVFILPNTPQTSDQILAFKVISEVRATRGRRWGGYSLVQFQLRPEVTGNHEIFEEIFINIDAKNPSSAPKITLEAVINQVLTPKV